MDPDPLFRGTDPGDLDPQPKCHGFPTLQKTISEIKNHRGQVETGEAFCNVGLPPGALSRSAARTDVKRKKILTSVEPFYFKVHENPLFVEQVVDKNCIAASVPFFGCKKRITFLWKTGTLYIFF